ncbi:MAG: diacylglycerol kinase family protein [Devosia sp.]
MRSVALIFNAASGGHLDGEATAESIADLLRSRGLETQVLSGGLKAQIAASKRSRADAVVVSGGDGTIRSVMSAHKNTGRPIGIIPAGTMNLLAQDYGIPLKPAAAADVIAAGHTRVVDGGLIDGKVFLHSGFLGFPARIGTHRERRRGNLGVGQRVVLAAHALSTLRRDPHMTVTVEEGTGEGPKTLRSNSFALIAGGLGERPLAVPFREGLNAGHVTVLALHIDSGLEAARLLAKGVAGQLASDQSVTSARVTQAVLTSPRRRIHAMLDGESRLLRSPATIRVDEGAFTVICPAPS